MDRIIHSLFFILLHFLKEGFDISELLINEQIKDKEIRLIDNEGNQVGIISLQEALRLANEKDLDLVNISPNAQPPVCKVMDYGKYKFELLKKERESKKNQKVVVVKELRLSPSIEKHDIEIKISHAIKFLKAGNKVKVAIVFKGREMMHTQKGMVILNTFIDNLDGAGTVEKEPKIDGRSLILILAPKN